MSSRGKIDLQLAAYLRDLADRIDAQLADADDAEALRALARRAADEDKKMSIRVHRKNPGSPSHGAAGVDRRYRLALKVQAYRDEHNCSLQAAYDALGKTGVGEETLKKAWKEMGPILAESEDHRRALLIFKKLEARGLAKITRG